MTDNRHVRENMRFRCAKCGAACRWGEPCVLCGSTETAGERAYNSRPADNLRVGHGQVCTAKGEPHKCHCQGGKTHPCNCYESPRIVTPNMLTKGR